MFHFHVHLKQARKTDAFDVKKNQSINHNKWRGSATKAMATLISTSPTWTPQLDDYSPRMKRDRIDFVSELIEISRRWMNVWPSWRFPRAFRQPNGVPSPIESGRIDWQSHPCRIRANQSMRFVKYLNWPRWLFRLDCSEQRMGISPTSVNVGRVLVPEVCHRRLQLEWEIETTWWFAFDRIPLGRYTQHPSHFHIHLITDSHIDQ